MTKTLKRRIISSVTTLAMVFSLGAVSALGANDMANIEPTSVKLDYDRIEEMPDGGKIYIYVIDGVETKFPVPPEGFKPLTATDEKLEIYGFPPRPDKENAKDYEDWAEQMEYYKSTPVPALEMTKTKVKEEEDNGINTLSVVQERNNPTFAGYGSMLNGTQFYTQLQVDYVQPTIIEVSGDCANEYWVGFGRGNFNIKNVVAGTKNIGMNKPYAYYKTVNKSLESEERRIPNFSVNAGDKLHIYISFQKANSCFTYYFANNTTGQSVSNIVSLATDDYFEGRFAAWCMERPLKGYGTHYNLGKTSVTFTNCKAMLNTSTTWTDLSSLDNIIKFIMTNDYNNNNICITSAFKSSTSFICRWRAYT